MVLCSILQKRKCAKVIRVGSYAVLQKAKTAGKSHLFNGMAGCCRRKQERHGVEKRIGIKKMEIATEGSKNGIV